MYCLDTDQTWPTAWMGSCICNRYDLQHSPRPGPPLPDDPSSAAGAAGLIRTNAPSIGGTEAAGWIIYLSNA